MKTRISSNPQEYASLISRIKPGYYQIFNNPFPHWMPKPGRFNNNLTIVVGYELPAGYKIKDYEIKGMIFEYCFIRDDLKVAGDPNSKEINVDHRLLFKTTGEEIMQGSVKLGDHSLNVLDNSTAMPMIKKRLRLDELKESGSIADLRSTGIRLCLDNLSQ